MRVTLLVRISVLFVVLGFIAAMANPAAAAKPEKEIVNDSFDEVICDIPVHTTITGFEIFHIQDVVIESTGPDTDDFWIGVIQTHLDITWTNAEGVTLTNSVRQTNQEGALVDNGDGTWTYTYSINGKPLDLRSGKQHVLMDVGRITFEDVIYFGDLSTIEDNELVSSTITSISGPHPEAESDFTLFCEVFTDILG